MITKFVRHEIPPLETLKNSSPYIIHQKLESGEELTREEKNRLVIVDKLYGSTCIPLHGWLFDFSDWLTEYWVELQGWGIIKVYAYDKTAIRECGHYPGIIRIVEVE